MEAEFDGVPESVRAARAFVASTLAAWELGAMAEVAVLLTSELVTNAVRHAGTGYRLTVEHVPPELVVEVADESMEVPGPLDVPLDSEDGRGLWLVDHLAERWGVRTLARGGKVLWFALTPEDGAGRPPAGA